MFENIFGVDEMTDGFEAIDLKTWPRRDVYRLYTEKWPTASYSLTKKLDAGTLVPFLKQRGIKFVPAIIWLAAREVNRLENFRLAIHDGQLGRWTVVHPMFPTLNATQNMTFHCVRFEDDFSPFYEAYLKEQRENAQKTALFANRIPENSFMISVFPFLHFDGGSMQLSENGKYAPFLAIGQYNEVMQLPCLVMGNHACQDAWHVAQLFGGIQEGMDHPSEWCK